jgi:hypothetical protein
MSRVSVFVDDQPKMIGYMTGKSSASCSSDYLFFGSLDNHKNGTLDCAFFHLFSPIN